MRTARETCTLRKKPPDCIDRQSRFGVTEQRQRHARAREGRLRVDAVFFQNLRDGEDRANADFTHATLRVGRHGLRNKLRAHRQTLDGIHDHAAILAEIARR